MKTEQKRNEIINELARQSTGLQRFISAKYPGFTYEADDIVNETALKVLEMDFTKINDIRKPKTFSRSILYNTLYEMLRQAGSKGITKSDMRKEEYKQ